MESNVAQLPITDKLWAWFEANKKSILYAVGAALVIGLIVYFIVWQHDEKETKASEALSQVTLSQLTSGPRGENPQAYLSVASSYPGSSAAERAQLLAAGTLFSEGKYPDAQTQFEKFTHEHTSSTLMGEALLGIAACLDAQGKTNEAVAAYKNLIDHHPAEAVIPQAKFALACLYEAQNKPKEARDLFEEVARSNPYGSVGSEAGMRSEDLQAKHPELVPTAPAPAPTLPMTAPAKLSPSSKPAPSAPVAAPKQ